MGPEQVACADALQSLLPDDVSPALIYAICPPTLEDIATEVAEFYRLDLDTLLYQRGRSVGALKVSHIRQIAFYFARQITRSSHNKIAHYFGMGDHTTVHYGALKIASDLKKSEILLDDIDILSRRIAERVMKRCLQCH